MPCYYPLDAWRGHIPTKSGKYAFSFSPIPGQKPMQLPCGQCIGCRLEYSRQWAVRMMHEASMHHSNIFLTLTLDDVHLPRDWSLDKKLWQDFFKRLRKRFGSGPRYFHCGEYGELRGRPHYHACIFNLEVPDKQYLCKRGDYPVYTSKIFSELWKFGLHEIGEFTFDSAAYVARYVVDKVRGERLSVQSDPFESPYVHMDPETGEVFIREQEYVTMSRNPGIGSTWFDKYRKDVYPDDFVLVRGRKCKPPKYYKAKFEALDVNKSFELAQARRDAAKEREADNTPERLKVREAVMLSRVSKLKRGL